MDGACISGTGIPATRAVYIFALSVIFVFLALAAQYESWVLPLAIILIVPLAVLARSIGVHLRGMDNNILTQIGLIVLIGLAAEERDPDRRIRPTGAVGGQERRSKRRSRPAMLRACGRS